MLQKAFSGEEKLDLDATKTKLGEDQEEPRVSCPPAAPPTPWILNPRWLLQTTSLWLPEREGKGLERTTYYGCPLGCESSVAGVVVVERAAALPLPCWGSSSGSLCPGSSLLLL